MNHKYYFVYGKKSGNQLTKAVRYRRLAVKTCARMNCIILPSTASKRPIEAMPLFPDYKELPAAADPEKRKRQYAVGYLQTSGHGIFSVWPRKAKPDKELMGGLGWILEGYRITKVREF